MKVLRSRLYEMERQARDDARAAERKSQVGSGDRSERIRTYNFPQGRVTDHRINLTLYKIDKVMSGEALDEIIDAILAEDQAARLAAVAGLTEAVTDTLGSILAEAAAALSKAGLDEPRRRARRLVAGFARGSRRPTC